MNMNFDSQGYVSTLSQSQSQFTDASPNPTKRRDVQPILPVTVKQISEATSSNDANFIIDGVDVFNVKLVGMVFDINTQRRTDVSFVIDDSTGRIACSKWINDSQDTKEVDQLTDGMHFRIHGLLKLYKDKKQIVVHAIRPVTDYNEIANHFLECIYAHCLHSKSQNSGNNQSVSTSSAVTTPNGNQAATTTPIGNQAVSSIQFSQDGPVNLETMITDFLRRPSIPENGMHKNEIAENLKIPLEKLEILLKSLEDNGEIYPTVDDFHFKICISDYHF